MNTLYEKTQPVAGDVRRAMEFVVSTLSAAGFRMEGSVDSTLRATAPRMYNTGQNSLLAASKIEVRATGGALSARAELKGATWLLGILAGVLVGLAVVETSLSLWLPGFRKYSVPVRLLMMDGPLLPWVVIFPLMSRWMRGRGRKAVDALLANAAVMAGGKG
jgi:hypothetical protein